MTITPFTVKSDGGGVMLMKYLPEIFVVFITLPFLPYLMFVFGWWGLMYYVLGLVVLFLGASIMMALVLAAALSPFIGGRDD